MTEKFQIQTEAELYIHNDLSGVAQFFCNSMNAKQKSGQTDDVYFDMIASLVFSAFSIEAKVNFVGWKVLERGWPERSNLREKIELLDKVLKLNLHWGQRPLQTVLKLKKLRDTFAHGKPEIISRVDIVDIAPDIWSSLKSQWEDSVNPDFVMRSREDEAKLWNILLERASIDRSETLTSGGQSLKSVVAD